MRTVLFNCFVNIIPIADHKEYRPPTQSQNPNILRSSMPNSRTFRLLVDNATKCLATAEFYKYLKNAFFKKNN